MGGQRPKTLGITRHVVLVFFGGGGQNYKPAYFVIIYAKEVVIFNMQTSFAKMYNVRIVGTAQNKLK